MQSVSLNTNVFASGDGEYVSDGRFVLSPAPGPSGEDVFREPCVSSNTMNTRSDPRLEHI